MRPLFPSCVYCITGCYPALGDGAILWLAMRLSQRSSVRWRERRPLLPTLLAIAATAAIGATTSIGHAQIAPQRTFIRINQLTANLTYLFAAMTRR